MKKSIIAIAVAATAAVAALGLNISSQAAEQDAPQHSASELLANSQIVCAAPDSVVKYTRLHLQTVNDNQSQIIEIKNGQAKFYRGKGGSEHLPLIHTFEMKKYKGDQEHTSGFNSADMGYVLKVTNNGTHVTYINNALTGATYENSHCWVKKTAN